MGTRVHPKPRLDERDHRDDEIANLRARLAELEESQEKYRLALEGANEGLWEWNPVTKALSISPRLLALLGRKPPGPTSTHIWLKWVHPDDRKRYEAAVRAHLRGDTEHFECEYRVRHADGRYVWMQARGLATRDSDGRSRRMAGSVGDITPRKEAERALLRSKQEAEFANNAKTMFLANMSHELRTPLNAMLGFTEMMIAEVYGPVGDPKYADYLGDIRNSAHHLSRLIGDILDVAKIEVGQIKIDPAPVDLDERIQIATRLNLARATARGVQLQRRLDDGPVRLSADASRVLQILTNLVSNAIKFTPEGGQVTLFAKRLKDGGVDLGVEDTGVGIDPKDIARVVEPFAQLDEVWTKRCEGSGLGLHIVKALAQMHGAHLTIDSAPGAGATVAVRFPVERVL